MNIQKEINELEEAQACKNSSIFQKYFADPILKELDEMKSAYSCDTLKELHRLKGKKDGLMFFLKLLKKIDEDYKIKKEQLKADTEE